MSLQYRLYSKPQPTTTVIAKNAFAANTIKTILQFKPLLPCKIYNWGCSFDNNSANVPGTIELLDTGTVAATVTAFANADIVKLNAAAREFGDPTSALISVGTSASGYDATAEGTITATQLYDALQQPPTQPYVMPWPLGREGEVKASNIIRIRGNFASAVNVLAFIDVEF